MDNLFLSYRLCDFLNETQKKTKKNAKERGILGWGDMAAWRDSDLRRGYIGSLYPICDI
jgi:hypothetical protein